MNKELQKVIARLLEHINLAPSEFLRYPEGELRRRPAPDKWSKKEIIFFNSYFVFKYIDLFTTFW